MILRDIRKKVKKIEPIDIIEYIYTIYLHVEILRKVPLIEEIEPMSINEIRETLNIDQIENQETFRNKKKRSK